jgi:tetratricopeptide (TPR) repeat protein
MNAKRTLALAAIVLAASSGALLGRGGAGFHGGGGYHVGGGGGGGYHVGGGGGGGGGGGYHAPAYHSPGSYGGGYHAPAYRSPGSYGGERYGGDRYGSGYHGAPYGGPHTPALSEPRLPANAWSNYGARAAVAARPAGNLHPFVGPHPDWYHGHWNDHWNHPWNHWPAAWWGAGFIAGLGYGTIATPWAWGYWPYYNPYVGEPVLAEGAWIDYSQPLAMAGPGPGESNSQAAADQVTEALDAARAAFLQADYSGALADCDKAVALDPTGTMSHEFRALCLFALHRYDEAAGAVYAVLSQGPGWDWTTLSSIYPDVAAYTDQLRGLEEFVAANRNDAAARFLLAYHYTVCGHTDAAATELKAVVALNPKDRLSAQLLAMLAPGAAPPGESLAASLPPGAPAPPAAPRAAVSPKAPPVTAAALTGDWKATRADGATISLRLGQDGNYVWSFDEQGKPHEFSGSYTVADGLLILKKDNTPMMIGQVTQLPNGFNFKLPGDNPSDPGLNFSR